MAHAQTFDPFTDTDEVERTFIKPNPAGRRPVEAPRARTADAVAISASKLDVARLNGVNPLVAAANPLLILVGHLRNTVAHSDVTGLRERLLQAVKAFEAHARARKVEDDTVLAARYVLCTFVDETIMSLPWGRPWGASSLLVTFHSDNLGGEKVFALAERAMEDAHANINVLELLYLCVALGFQGRYRLKSGGREQLNDWRDQLHQVIRRERGEFERELSPYWQGAVEKRNPLMRIVPLWVIAACAVAVLLAVYVFLSVQLSKEAEPVLKSLASIPGNAFDPPPARVIHTSRLKAFLAPEIAQNLVRVDDLSGRTKVTIIGDRLFDSGSATLNTHYLPLMQRIAAALDDEPGRVQVIGHTDDRRIVSARFPSNWDLSQARAEEVARLLTGTNNESRRFHAIGRGDTEPLVANDSASNRARNRRVEIVVFNAASGRADGAWTSAVVAAN